MGRLEMRITKQWLGVAVVGTMLGAACSSDDRSTQPTNVRYITPTDAGAPGSDAGGDAGAGASSGGAAGAAGVENLAGAGAGGADPCVGEYLCPSVIYWSHVVLKVDLPVSVADAADAIFTACRKDQCYSGNGSAKVQTPREDAWLWTQEGANVYLQFDGSGTTPFLVLDWEFSFGGPQPDTTREHYSLRIQPTGAAAATTLFDDDVDYSIVPDDPSLVKEGFCRYCSLVAQASVDARAGQ